MNRPLPELTDERIDTMRDGLLTSIDTHVARRTRRHRVVGAAGVLAVAALVVTPVLTSQDDTPSGAEASRAEVPGFGSVTDESADSDSSAAGDSSGERQDARDVITTGEVSVVVDDPGDAAGELSDWVLAAGGRVDDLQEGSSDATYSTLTVRVPSDDVTKTLDEVRTYGEVENITIAHDDVTDTSRDLAARIKALQVSVDRLQDIMSKATSSDSLLKAETALSERQEQLEALQTQQASLDDQVDLSTLHVSFTEKAKAGSVSPGGFAGGLLDGWNGLVATVDTLVTAVGVVIPWLALGALAIGAVLGVRRLRRPATR